MKKYTLIIFILLFSTNIYSQNLDSIRKADTVYIYFKEDAKYQLYIKENVPWIKYLYEEYLFNSKNGKYIFMQFIHSLKISPEERKEKISFLRNKKDLIITYDYLANFNSIEALDLIGNKKKVYLIDYKDIGWFKIKLKEVKVIGTHKVNEE